MANPNLDRHPGIDTGCGGWAAGPWPLWTPGAETRPELDEPRHRLTLADLLALSPLMRPWRLRADSTVNPPPLFDPRSGRTSTLHRRVHAVRLPRAFRLDTLTGTVRGGEDDYLLLAATGVVSTVSEPELLASHDPLHPPPPVEELPAWAARVAASLLGPLGDRWWHTVTAARHAEHIAGALPDVERPLLLAAAWLHDIGYHPALAATGLHHLDGALTLDGLVPPRLVGLIAHHGAGDAEAELRRTSIALDCFPGEASLLADALDYCDLTAGPDGRPMRPEERIEEVLARYGEGHVVARAMASRRGELLAACTRIASSVGATRTAGRRPARPPGQQAADEHRCGPVEIICWLREHGLGVKDLAAALGTRPNRIRE